jgi:tetratricopeptide (TPR) repeat protein
LLPIGVFDRRLGGASLVDEERVRIYIMQWWLNFFESPHRTLLYSLKTLNESERSGAIVGIVHSCSTLGFICCVLGAPGIAQEYHARASLRARDSDNPVVFGHAALGLGWHGSYTGRWDGALEHFRRSAAASRGAGDLRQWGSATWGMVLVLCHLGRFADAWTHAHELFEISEASGDQVNLRWSHVAKGMVLLRIGAFDMAERNLEVAMREGQNAADWQIYTKSLCELARSSLQQDHFEKASSLVDEAVATVRRYGLRGHHVTELKNVKALLLQAKLARTRGGFAVSTLRWRIRWACFQAIRGGSVYRGSLPEALRLRGQFAWLVENPNAAQAWWQRSRRLCEQLGATYDLALTELELGRCLRDPESLARGEALLAEARQGVPASLMA